MCLVTPKAGAKREILFNKPAPEKCERLNKNKEIQGSFPQLGTTFKKVFVNLELLGSGFNQLVEVFF